MVDLSESAAFNPIGPERIGSPTFALLVAIKEKPCFFKTAMKASWTGSRLLRTNFFTLPILRVRSVCRLLCWCAGSAAWKVRARMSRFGFCEAIGLLSTWIRGRRGCDRIGL